MKKPTKRPLKLVAREPLKQIAYLTAAPNGKGTASKWLPIYLIVSVNMFNGILPWWNTQTIGRF
ncbi:hypothetical protein JTI58_22960 [Lysinibacillus fusiformis]|uniref:hypothetical protein n=1 Tax=Lysinibacillus fusiformis TaxID=28031 RepID=UPI001967B350|nr:hypothetical protein [Lysinibacillus fusiformis]QSB09802.1 hypothetical protein JTI58_22960 [Lysinibacillus fusiformis]